MDYKNRSMIHKLRENLNNYIDPRAIRIIIAAIMSSISIVK